MEHCSLTAMRRVAGTQAIFATVSVSDADELSFATHPLHIERVTGGKRQLVRKQKHARSPTVGNALQCREHLPHPFGRGRDGCDPNMLNTQIAHVPLLSACLVVCQHLFCIVGSIEVFVAFDRHFSAIDLKDEIALFLIVESEAEQRVRYDRISPAGLHQVE